MIVPRLPTTSPKKLFVDVDQFGGGTLTNISQARADKKFAIESTNMEQYADAIWRTRPGTAYYGTTLAANPDSAAEYESLAGVRQLIAFANGTSYKSTDAGAQSALSGATFTTGNYVYTLQSRSNLYASNRVDPFAVYNGTSWTTYSAIGNPSAPSGARTTLTAGSFNNFYRVQAVNTVGFTEPSTSLSITTNKHRDAWTGTELITLTLTRVAGATGYQIFWGEYDGEEQLIFEVAEPPGVGTFTTDDTGQANIPVNTYIEPADDNTTAAPKFGPMEISGNRMWGTYDPDNQWRVYFSGTGVDFARFSAFYGGGYIDLEKGGKAKPIHIAHYRTGKGDPVVTVLCKSPDGQGTTFQVELTSTTVGEGASATTFTIPVAYKIVGSIGSDCPRGVVKASNSLMFPNKKGVYFLRNQAQIFQVLSSDDATQNIRNQWEGLNQALIGQIAGYYKPPRAYFCVPVGTTNDKTTVYDFERTNWTWAWSIGFKQLLEYTDSNGVTHFLGIPNTGTKFVEISENYVGDFGAAFYQSYISPLLSISDDKTDKAKVKYVIFEIGNFQGDISVEVLGLNENGTVTSVASESATSTTGTTGWGDDPFSDVLFSETTNTPTTFTQSTINIPVRVEKRLKAIQFKVSSNTLTRFEILRIQAKGVIIPGRPVYN